jgi:WD40 repeat protein
MRGQPLHSWKGGFRVQDCAISADGRRLVAADTEAKIHVYNFMTYEEEYSLPLPSKPTSVAISQDSLHVLINLAEGEIQLVNMETTALVRQFRGQKQGEFVIRSTFGGAAENFIVSGSEGEYFKPGNIMLLTLPRLESLHLAQRERQPR